MKLSPSEKHIIQLFRSRYQIELEKIDEHGGQEGKTADFEFREKNQSIFVCELKDLRKIKPSKETGWKVREHSNVFKSFSRISNTIGRISDAIYTSHKQLENYDVPKVLILLNYSHNLGVNDLEETFRGYRILEVDSDGAHIDGYAKRASEGKIKNVKMNIDLYVWVDVVTDKSVTNISEDPIADKIYCRYTTEKGRNIIRQYFQLP